MIDRISRILQEATDTIREQTAHLGEGAKERSNQLIEEWLQIFPKLEVYGLKITSLSLGVALSPSLEVELLGQHGNFGLDRVQQLIDENRKDTALVTVFTAIKTAYTLHRRIYADLRDPLVVKIRVRLSPEVKVIIGEPLIQ